MRYFLEQRRGGAGMCCPKSVSSPFADCSAQELGWCRWGDRASRLSGPAGLGGHCWGICAKGLRTPNHASPQRRIHWVWVSGSRDPQQREGPGSPRQPIPAFPDVQRQSGCENGLRYFLEQRRGGAGIAPRGMFPVPLQTAGPRNSVGAFGELGPWCGLAQLHLGCIPGAWAKKAYARSILLPREGEHVGSGIQAPKTPCKAAGLREPEAAQPGFAGLRAGGWVRKRLLLLS